MSEETAPAPKKAPIPVTLNPCPNKSEAIDRIVKDLEKKDKPKK